MISDGRQTVSVPLDMDSGNTAYLIHFPRILKEFVLNKSPTNKPFTNPNVTLFIISYFLEEWNLL